LEFSNQVPKSISKRFQSFSSNLFYLNHGINVQISIFEKFQNFGLKSFKFIFEYVLCNSQIQKKKRDFLFLYLLSAQNSIILPAQLESIHCSPKLQQASIWPFGPTVAHLTWSSSTLGQGCRAAATTHFASAAATL
jgi:hypothetical protein